VVSNPRRARRHLHSAWVQEGATGRLDFGFENIGEQALKNIARPAFAVPVRLIAQAARYRPLSSDPFEMFFAEFLFGLRHAPVVVSTVDRI
jgi:hypothetical protein